MRKTKCFWGLAGTLLAAGALYADTTTNICHTFETEAQTNLWAGGSWAVSNYAFTATAGLPISSALPEPNHVLLVEGDATCVTNVTGSPLVDMMIQTAWPEEELAFPSSEDTTDIQIAVAVDTNGCFNAFCKGKSSTTNWYRISNTPTVSNGWARVSFLFDYNAGLCQIRINGEPAMSEHGYLTTNKTVQAEASGAWYVLANNPETANTVGSMKVIGCTAIDEVLMATSAESYAIASTATTNGVPCSWLDSYGLAWDTTQSYDGTITVAEKYKSCLSPFDGQTFELKSVATSDKNIVLGIPTFVTTTGRKVLLQYSNSSSFDTIAGTQNVATGTETVTIETLPSAGSTYYFRLLGTDDTNE